MRFSCLATLLMAGALAGCASSPAGPPVTRDEVLEVETALRNAEAAGADERAPELLEEAHISFDAARRTSGEEARRRLLEARDYATAAEAMARAEKLRNEAAHVRQEAEELERQADQIRDEAGRPPHP